MRLSQEGTLRCIEFYPTTVVVIQLRPDPTTLFPTQRSQPFVLFLFYFLDGGSTMPLELVLPKVLKL